MQYYSQWPDDDPIAARVKELVSENRGVPVEKLKWEDALYHDLKMYGDDVPDFFEEFLKEFDVDMSEFEFDVYFPAEGWNLFEFFAGLMGKPKSYIPITIFDLVNIAKSKKWKLQWFDKCENIDKMKEI